MDAATCLGINHQVRTVQDTFIIATRQMTNVRKPHPVNSSGIGHRNCGCALCYRDRTQLDCAHPGKCIETAKILIDRIFAKWNPAIPNPDLCEELSLTEEEPYLGAC
ncbi:hypothetical protein DFH07DRAFT_741475 [Mycena maculata]|uniref:Uncharacterized protein n=1 Tax=Mycena maculata TaxID=230809 RepID=A0AAD7JB01_9AGAR|nr:hypothetical protein DFH07DRAFT_741475 [Mycena maculata]